MIDINDHETIGSDFDGASETISFRPSKIPFRPQPFVDLLAVLYKVREPVYLTNIFIYIFSGFLVP